MIELTGLMNFAVVDVDGRKEGLRIISAVEGNAIGWYFRLPLFSLNTANPKGSRAQVTGTSLIARRTTSYFQSFRAHWDEQECMPASLDIIERSARG